MVLINPGGTTASRLAGSAGDMRILASRFMEAVGGVLSVHPVRCMQLVCVSRADLCSQSAIAMTFLSTGLGSIVHVSTSGRCGCASLLWGAEWRLLLFIPPLKRLRGSISPLQTIKMP